MLVTYTLGELTMTWTPEYRAMYKQRVRDWYNDYKAEIKCAHCGLPGNIWPDKLQFHHSEPDSKVANVGSMVQWGWSIERIKEEIEKCTPLCEDCHAKIHGFRNAEDMSPWKKDTSSLRDEPYPAAQDVKLKHRSKKLTRGTTESGAQSAVPSMKSQR